MNLNCYYFLNHKTTARTEAFDDNNVKKFPTSLMSLNINYLKNDLCFV